MMALVLAVGIMLLLIGCELVPHWISYSDPQGRKLEMKRDVTYTQAQVDKLIAEAHKGCKGD